MTEHDSPQPTTFGLIRDHDVTGISGTGRVADGTLWPDGTVSVRWRGDRPSIVHWDALADVERVHGHGGHTRIVWDTEQQAPTPWAYQQACKALETHRQRADTAEGERDGAYRERAQLLAWLAALHPAVIAPALDLDEPGWWILFLNPAAGGQMSWHISPRDAGLLAHVERVEPDDRRAQWDGHTTEAKYQRVAALTAELAERCGPECSEMHTDTGRCEIARARRGSRAAGPSDDASAECRSCEHPRHAPGECTEQLDGDDCTCQEEN